MSASATPGVIIVTPQPRAAARATPTVAAATPRPAAIPTVGSGPLSATGVVHAYLAALARGDESSAASYLMNGLPTEKFMSSAAKITSIASSKNSDGSYKVTADVQAASGEYFETFTVENGPQGLQITDHFAIKPQ